MPRGKTVKGAVQQPAGGSGVIESLPDGVLEHILGFLPSAEAVRTSVLARRWRHLWKSATGLCVGCCDPDQQVSVEDLRSLVNHLLILRRGSPLEKCYFTFDAELISDDDVSHFIFKRDLRWCPVFTNLKTLLLNGYWYVPDDFRALACIHEHSSVLEKLTFELHEWFGYKVQIKLRVSSMKRSTAISEHLKKVEINCQKVDGTVLKVLKFLCAFNICFSLDEMVGVEIGATRMLYSVLLSNVVREG